MGDIPGFQFSCDFCFVELPLYIPLKIFTVYVILLSYLPQPSLAVEVM